MPTYNIPTVPTTTYLPVASSSTTETISAPFYPYSQGYNDYIYSLYLRNYFYGSSSSGVAASANSPIVEIKDPNNPSNVVTINPYKIFS